MSYKEVCHVCGIINPELRCACGRPICAKCALAIKECPLVGLRPLKIEPDIDKGYIVHG